MTSTAHEDQFTAPLAPATDRMTEWAQWAAKKRAEIDLVILAPANEAEAIAAWLDRHGYREIAARIRAGEYRT